MNSQTPVTLCHTLATPSSNKAVRAWRILYCTQSPFELQAFRFVGVLAKNRNPKQKLVTSLHQHTPAVCACNARSRRRWLKIRSFRLSFTTEHRCGCQIAGPSYIATSSRMPTTMPDTFSNTKLAVHVWGDWAVERGGVELDHWSGLRRSGSQGVAASAPAAARACRSRFIFVCSLRRGTALKSLGLQHAMKCLDSQTTCDHQAAPSGRCWNACRGTGRRMRRLCRWFSWRLGRLLLLRLLLLQVVRLCCIMLR